MTVATLDRRYVLDRRASEFAEMIRSLAGAKGEVELAANAADRRSGREEEGRFIEFEAPSGGTLQEWSPPRMSAHGRIMKISRNGSTFVGIRSDLLGYRLG